MSGRLSDTAIRATERRLGVQLPYMREIARVAPGLLARLGAFNGVAGYAGHAPDDVRHLAALGAARAQDCGACVQIGVNLALAAGVDADVLRAAIGAESPAELSEAQDEALAFGRAVALQDPSAADLRERLRARHGDAAVVELAWAVAVAQFYPVLKRGMGFAEACSVYGPTVGA